LNFDEVVKGWNEIKAYKVSIVLMSVLNLNVKIFYEMGL